MAAAPPQLATQLYLSQARASGNVGDCMALYDKWAATYNDEVGDAAQNYVAPRLVAELVVKTSKTDLATNVILDAGCGTGLVGEALAPAGAKIIDGFDLSDPMLKIARNTGVYRHLTQVDMNEKLKHEDNTYDTVTCVGTFTAGHVGAQPALPELVRVTKKGGVLIATILEEVWEQMGFKDEIARLTAANEVTVIAAELLDYVKGHGDKAIFAILQKN